MRRRTDPTPLPNYAHPSEAAYKAGCGCDPCHIRRRRIDKARKIYGTDMVDAEPSRQWVKQLLSDGFTTKLIGKAANVEPKIVWNLTNTGQVRIHGKHAQALLAVTRSGIIASSPDNSEVPVLGATRRVQALMRMGWSLRSMSSNTSEVQALSKIGAGRNPMIEARTYRWVADLYDRLALTPGPSNSARIRATKRGVAPPLAWDDEELDDPAAAPHVDVKPPKPNAPASRMSLYQQGVSDAAIARHEGVSTDTIRYWRISNNLPSNHNPHTATPLGEEGDNRYALWQQGLTDRQISEKVGRHPDVIRRWRLKHRLQGRRTA